MDYKTKATTREKIRGHAVSFRKEFNVSPRGKVDVIYILEKVPDVLDNTSFQIVEDEELPINVPAQCILQDEGRLEIQIKDSVYDGARKKETGAYRCHILHEICHAYLFTHGFYPVADCKYKDGELHPYESAEWQAKALCGEIMMPYEETKLMTVNKIMYIYKVSKEQARYRYYKY